MNLQFSRPAPVSARPCRRQVHALACQEATNQHSAALTLITPSLPVPASHFPTPDSPASVTYTSNLSIHVFDAYHRSNNMDTTVDAEWDALFDFPSDSTSFDFTGLNGFPDSDGFDSPLICLSGQSTPGEGQRALKLGDGLQSLLDSTASGETAIPVAPMPKAGGRFSREVVRMLRNWLTAHKARPYPTNEEMEMLQQRTGLNKTQIANWFANARRRGKLPRPPSPHSSPNNSGRPVEIAPRPGTPAPMPHIRSMNPMERWQSSPPEHEPAAASAIARAVESNGGVPLRM